jgi:hypothetical protein
MECGWCKATGHVYQKTTYTAVDEPIMGRTHVTYGEERQIGTKTTTYASGGGYVTCPRCGGTGKVPY